MNGKERFGLVRVHFAIGPAKLAQHLDFFRRHLTVSQVLHGEVVELHTHYATDPRKCFRRRPSQT